jgi:hypothetical protein
MKGGRLQANNVSFYVKPVQIINYFLKNILSVMLVVLFLVFSWRINILWEVAIYGICLLCYYEWDHIFGVFY